MKFVLSFTTLFFALSAFANNNEEQEKKQVKLEAAGKQIVLILENNIASEEFYNKLPMSLFMNNDFAIMKGHMSDTLSSKEASVITTSKGWLYYYPLNNDIYFMHDMSINTITLIPLAKQRGLKNIFENTPSSCEVTFSKIE